MTQSNPTPARHFHWRRLFQYRIRTLLILTAVVGIPLGWWSWKVERQRRAVETLIKNRAYVFCQGERIGYSITHRPQFWSWRNKVELVSLNQDPVDDDIQALQTLDGL
ncbi:MAG: hypothetical protein K8T91_04910 [Planctomycetes bacterium]|nr:hypothetical protein [Planctomycetota bacterium]